MKEVFVKLNGMEDVKEFNAVVSGINGDIDLVSGRYVVDAKSIMGIFSLDISKVIVCRINAASATEEEKAVEKISKWVKK